MAHTSKIGIALSGGGHRATAFSLGGLLAVADSELNRETVSISSVSGGSIANAIAMTGPDFAVATVGEIEAHFAPGLRAVSDRGVLLGGTASTAGLLKPLIGAPATKWYTRALVVSGLVGVVAMIAAFVTAIIDRPGTRVALAVGVVGLVAAWLLFRQRSARTQRAIDKEVLGDRAITLGAIMAKESSVHHVICTTELQSGEPLYFTNRGVWNYRFGGSTTALKIPLAAAVQASACVPGAFNPRGFPLAALGLQNRTVVGAKKGHVTHTVIDKVVLDDGGVYDNMADEWEYGFSNRAENWPALAQIQPHGADYLIILNGSGGWNQPKPIPNGGFKQELQGLLRAQGVQYDVSTTHRRRALYSIFRSAEDAPKPGDVGRVDGIFAQIADSPYRAAQRFSSAKLNTETDPSKLWPVAMALRADRVIEFLNEQGYTPQTWQRDTHSVLGVGAAVSPAGIVDDTSGAPTTLAALGSELTSRLVEHGYVLTMTLLYLYDNKCALRPIDRTRFKGLCQ